VQPSSTIPIPAVVVVVFRSPRTWESALDRSGVVSVGFVGCNDADFFNIPKRSWKNVPYFAIRYVVKMPTRIPMIFGVKIHQSRSIVPHTNHTIEDANDTNESSTGMESTDLVS